MLVGHPLDTIKVRIQAMEVVAGKAPQYSGMIDCAKQIVAKQGVQGLYSGMAAPLAGTPPCPFSPPAIHHPIFWCGAERFQHCGAQYLFLVRSH